MPHLSGLWVTGWFWTPPGGYPDGLTRMVFDPIVDGVKPRVAARTIARQPARVVTKVPFRLTWTARDPDTIPSPKPRKVVPGSGIARFQIESRRNAGAWTLVKTVPGDARATTVRVLDGGRVEVRIRARDRAGNWSTWSAWDAVRP